MASPRTYGLPVQAQPGGPGGPPRLAFDDTFTGMAEHSPYPDDVTDADIAAVQAALPAHAPLDPRSDDPIVGAVLPVTVHDDGTVVAGNLDLSGPRPGRPDRPRRHRRGMTSPDTALIARLRDVATERTPHDYAAGLCPNLVEGPDVRNPDCPACRVLADADRALADAPTPAEQTAAADAMRPVFDEPPVVAEMRRVIESPYHLSEQQEILARGGWHAPDRTPAIIVSCVAAWLHETGHHQAGRTLEQAAGTTVPCHADADGDSRTVLIGLLQSGVDEHEAVELSGYQRCPLDPAPADAAARAGEHLRRTMHERGL